MHDIHTDWQNPQGCRWEWDGNIIAPTFSPHIVIERSVQKRLVSRCHYTLIRGQLSYQSDCTHTLKDVTMRLPAIPDYLRDR